MNLIHTYGSHQACGDSLTTQFSWLNKLLQISSATDTSTHMLLAHSRCKAMSHKLGPLMTDGKSEDWNFWQVQRKEGGNLRLVMDDTGVEMKPGLQKPHKQGGIPIPCKPDSFLQSALKSHQLRNGPNNLGWGSMPVISICLSMTKVNTQLKYFSTDHFLLFSPSPCSKPPQKFSFKKLFAAKLKLRLLEEMKPPPFQLQHLEQLRLLFETEDFQFTCCQRRFAEDNSLLTCPISNIDGGCSSLLLQWRAHHFSSHYYWNGFMQRCLTLKWKGWSMRYFLLTCQSSSVGASRPKYAVSRTLNSAEIWG